MVVDEIGYLFLGFFLFLIVRRIILSQIVYRTQKKHYRKEYVDILQGSEFKVKGKYE